MRYLSASFTGYNGFYYGLGLTTVFFDFTKCRSNTILIIGKNGSGKSTLETHLNPNPDPSISFVTGMDASKELIIADNENIYRIFLESKADGEKRKTTKAYIQKNNLELNPNGNVSSYKEILFSEFEMDPNYSSLSMLSSIDRGMGDKTPAERKKFVSSIIDNLEVYNDIYKTLNKKSLVYKSNLNNIHTKIQNIGNRGTIEVNMTNLRRKEGELLTTIESAKEKIIEIKAKATVSEDDLKEFEAIQNKLKELSELRDKYRFELKELDKKSRGVFVYSDDFLEDRKIKLEEYKSDLYKGEANRTSCLSILEQLRSRLRIIESQMDNFDEKEVNVLYTDSIKMIEDEIYKILEEHKKELETSDENVEKKIKILSDTIKRNERINTFVVSIKEYIDSFDLGTIDMDEKIYNDKDYDERIETIRDEIERNKSLQNAWETISSRPKGCKFNGCKLIKDSFELLSEEQLNKLEKYPNYLLNNIEICKESIIDIERSKKANSIRSEVFRRVMDFISYDLKYIAEISDEDDKRNFKTIIYEMISGEKMYYRLPEEIELYTTQINDYKRYLSLKKSLKKLEEGKKKVKIYFDLLSEKKDVQKQIESKEKELEELEKSIKITEVSKKNITGTIAMMEEYKSKLNQVNSIEADVSKLEEEINRKKSKEENNQKLLVDINTYQQEINEASEALKPIQAELNKIAGQLTLLDSYYKEYEEYKQQNMIIDTIKKYCSPTAGGIQTIYMEMYMRKTLQLCNDLLSIMFNNEYQLANFIINDKEFRIPFYNNGMIVDDISNGSMSQVCMMGTIINLVLFYQSSSKFNIPRLDEPDASLDSSNRSIFMNFLRECKNRLEIEQMFVISHSIEEDMTDCDVIILKEYPGFDYGALRNCNVIWEYKGGNNEQ